MQRGGRRRCFRAAIPKTRSSLGLGIVADGQGRRRPSGWPQLRRVNVVKDSTRDCPGSELDTWLSGERMTGVVDGVIEQRCA